MNHEGIGNLGPVVFTASSELVRTFDGFERVSRAVYADHEVLHGKPASEFTGEEGDEISFTMPFHASLGVSPAEEAERLREMKSSGNGYMLVIGGRVLGWYTIREVSEQVKHTLRGRTTVSGVDVSLGEYEMKPTPAAAAAVARDESRRDTTGRGGPQKVPGAREPLRNREYTIAR